MCWAEELGFFSPTVGTQLRSSAYCLKTNKKKELNTYGVVSTTEQWSGNVKSFRWADPRETADVKSIDKYDASITVAPSGCRDECVSGLSRNAQRSFC